MELLEEMRQPIKPVLFVVSQVTMITVAGGMAQAGVGLPCPGELMGATAEMGGMRLLASGALHLLVEGISLAAGEAVGHQDQRAGLAWGVIAITQVTTDSPAVMALTDLRAAQELQAALAQQGYGGCPAGKEAQEGRASTVEAVGAEVVGEDRRILSVDGGEQVQVVAVAAPAERGDSAALEAGAVVALSACTSTRMAQAVALPIVISIALRQELGAQEEQEVQEVSAAKEPDRAVIPRAAPEMIAILVTAVVVGMVAMAGPVEMVVMVSRVSPLVFTSSPVLRPLIQ